MMKRARAYALAGALILVSAGLGATSDRDYVEPMAREHAGDAPVAGAAAGTRAEGVRGELIEREGARAYLAKPADAPRGGLIVIHEWWGLNENIREMARRLAAEGYVALAIDLYDGEVAADAAQARELMAAAMQDPERVDRVLEDAYRWLRDEGGVQHVGSIGWCLGGALSLRTAILLPDELGAAVIYYGRVVTDAAELAPLTMPILGIFGGQDRGIPIASVRQFETTLETLGKTVEIVVYEDADHAFANPSGTRYAPEAAADAWRRTLQFLDEHL
jgi:carboxymethylenebutenolidase